MTHDKARAELTKGTAPELICATCPWDRLCIVPPTLSRADLDRKVDEAMANDLARDPKREGLPVEALLTAMTFSGHAGASQLCPVFALRLTGPGGRIIADSNRALMQRWIEPT